MTKHYEAVEADFQQYYGIHLGELLFGGSGVPIRRLAGLVYQLPAESRTTAIASGEAKSEWTLEAKLTALLLEGQNATQRLLVKLLASKAPPLGDPLRIEWPGRVAAEPQRRAPSTKQEIARFLGAGRVKVIPGGRNES